MAKLDVVREIQNHDDLLSLPQALSEIIQEMDKPEFSSEVLANIILKDPALTARILKLANSAFYNRFSEIKTVNSAVQLLGVTTVKCLALSSSVFHPEKIEKDSGLDAKEYFSRILTVAAAAEKIATKIKFKAPEEAFIAGLLHDVGTMYFLHHHPFEYRKILDGKVKAASIKEAEEAIFNINHCEVGYQLAIRWRLPVELADAIRDQDTTADKKDHIISNIIRLSRLFILGDNLGDAQSNIDTKISRINEVAKILGLTKDDVDSISVSLLSWTKTVADYLGVDIGNIEDMLTRANQEIWRTYLIVENLFKERQELSKKLLNEEREKGAIESKNVAIATMSHYLNNATMAIYGRSQLLRMKIKNEKPEKLVEQLSNNLDIIDKSIKKIVAVLSEIKEITPLDEIEFMKSSSAMNLDDKIAQRINEMELSAEEVSRLEATAT